MTTRNTLTKLADNDLLDLKLTFTDPTNGKQLRISAKNVRMMTESSTLDIGGMGLDVEFFCDNLITN